MCICKLITSAQVVSYSHGVKASERGINRAMLAGKGLAYGSQCCNMRNSVCIVLIYVIYILNELGEIS